MDKRSNAIGIGEFFQNWSSPREYIELIISLKLCRNLCLFRAVKSNCKRVISFAPLLSWTVKTEFSLGLTKFRILNLNLFIKSIFLNFSLRFPHTSAQCGKKDDSKILVLARNFFIVFWVQDRVKYVLNFLHGIR